ncbi:MAG: hypothetical protein M1818_002137 [Claussenomyces sp. TS43310]|nr:MAG: hypothetical protein M1818_002137 [Claussenomyces sp. TS43310]
MTGGVAALESAAGLARLFAVTTLVRAAQGGVNLAVRPQATSFVGAGAAEFRSDMRTLMAGLRHKSTLAEGSES